MRSSNKYAVQDKRVNRPVSIKDAKRLIKQTFEEQGKLGWDRRDRRVYFELIGVDGMEKADDVRKIIARLEVAKMLLFENDG